MRGAVATERREIGLNERSPRPQTLFMCVQCAMGLLGYNLMAAIYLFLRERVETSEVGQIEREREGFEFIFVLTNCPSLSRLAWRGEERANKKVSSPVTFSPHSFVRRSLRECRRYLVCMKNVAARRDPFQNRFPSLSLPLSLPKLHKNTAKSCSRFLAATSFLLGVLRTDLWQNNHNFCGIKRG